MKTHQRGARIERRDKDMKYILMMMGTKADFDWFAKWSKEDLQAHIAFMHAFNKELKDSGTFVAAEGLAFPDQARIVRTGRTESLLPTESSRNPKSFSLDSGSLTSKARSRRIRIAARASAAPAPRHPPRNCGNTHRGAANDERPTGRIAVKGQPLDVSIEHLLRELTPQVLGTVVRRFRDFAAAEDAVQEASLAAATQWPRDGLPDNPRAWLTQAAFRRMADHIRSEAARRRRESEVALEEAYRRNRRPSRLCRRKTTRWSCSSCAAILR